MKKKNIIIAATLVVIAAIVGLVWFFHPTYLNPSDMTDHAHPHSYKEICEYATALDPNATVEKDAVESNGYRIYSATINGIDCRIASAPVEVLGRSKANENIVKTFYTIENDYHYAVVKKVMTKYPELGELASAESDCFGQITILSFVENVDDVQSLWKVYKKAEKEITDIDPDCHFWVHVNDGEYNFTPMSLSL